MDLDLITRSPEQSGYITTVVFVTYTAGIFFIAYFAFRKTHHQADFLLANRELRGWSAALSAGASDMSGWLLLGLPGLAYVAHLEACWLAFGLALGTYCNWKFIAAPLRRISVTRATALTLPEYFANRYPECPAALRMSTASLILIFYVFYISAGFVAAAKLFVAVFHIEYFSALLIGAFTVVSYTLIGGFRAVVNTDCFQALMMILALIVVVAILASGSGSATPAPPLFDVTPIKEFGYISIVSALAWGLGYPGQPHILVRFMAMRGEREIRAGRHIAVTWTVICLSCAVAVGALASQHPLLGEFGGDPEQIFILAVEILFHPLVAGTLSAAVLAAIMSTADSQLLIAATALFHDLAHGKTKDQNAKLWLRGIRATLVVIAIAGFMLATDAHNSVLGLVSYAWAGFGATLGPALILSIFAPKLHGFAVLAGMLAGALTVIIWEMQAGQMAEIYSLLPGFLVNFLVAAIAAIWLQRPLTA